MENNYPSYKEGGTNENLIIILGPTAVGKTELSLDLAEEFNGEIISGDSMQVYRYMDIGTAKLPKEERRNIPHHLMDILDPSEAYSVAQFQSQAKALITEINTRNKTPLIVGGTGLYISSIISPYLFTPESAIDQEFRKQKLAEFAKDNGYSLHRELVAVDPKAACRIHQHDYHRLIRALEVYYKKGCTISKLQEQSKTMAQPSYNLALIGLTLKREELYERINQRVDIMLAQGFIDEVQNLLNMGYSRGLNSMQGLGYRQIAAYLAGECSLNEAVENMKTATRRFAKRQMTWFKRNNLITWFDKSYYTEYKDLVAAVKGRIRQALGED